MLVFCEIQSQEFVHALCCVHTELAMTRDTKALFGSKVPTPVWPAREMPVISKSPRLQADRSADVPTLFNILNGWMTARSSRDLLGLLEDRQTQSCVSCPTLGCPDLRCCAISDCSGTLCLHPSVKVSPLSYSSNLSGGLGGPFVEDGAAGHRVVQVQRLGGAVGDSGYSYALK